MKPRNGGQDTPLYDALKGLALRKPLLLNMPAHHGRVIAGLDPITELDRTEMDELGNLYEAGGPIARAQALWAKAWDMAHCQFLTGGSTQGIFAALLASCRPGDEILVDRCCHRSVFNAMALLDLRPHWLLRGQDTPITHAQVDTALAAHPKVKAICITSPTYYGVLSEIPRVHGVTILVDGAHGAHLPFGMDNPYRGADLVVASAHKTLPALGQAALLFSGGRFSARALRDAAAVTGTSSPSYPILASMDLARAQMQSPHGAEAFARAARRVAALGYPGLGAVSDPLRLTLLVADGFAVQRALEEMDIFPEMADRHHVVFIFSPFDDEAVFDRLADGLEQIPAARCPAPGGLPQCPPPRQATSPRRAMFGGRTSMPLRDAAGQVAACQIAPYPPGVPVIAPGERIFKKHLVYLQEIGYNVDREVQVRSAQADHDARGV